MIDLVIIIIFFNRSVFQDVFLKASKTSRVLIICSSQKIFSNFVLFLSELRLDFNMSEYVIFHIHLFSDDLQPDKEFLLQLRNQTEIPTMFKISVATPKHPPVQHCQVGPRHHEIIHLFNLFNLFN